jgi:hypothetical protein
VQLQWMLRVEFTRGMELARLAVDEIRTVADDWIPTGVSLKQSILLIIIKQIYAIEIFVTFLHRVQEHPRDIFLYT